ncbi:MAG: hypothetical protein V2A55_03160 [Candidatus Jorgensenbacteria bacterium]
MITISKTELAKRWDELSQSLRDALWSEYNADILWDTCKKEHLSEDKTQIIAALAGDVIMGFLLPEDLSKEIAENTEINREIANNIAQEIEKKILRLVINEIREIYSPPVEKEMAGSVKDVKGEDVVRFEKLSAEKPAEIGIEIKRTPASEEPLIPISKPEVKTVKEQPAGATEARPFVIHKEEEQRPVTEDKKFKGFEFPFGVFGGEKGGTISKEPVRVRVETPGQEKPLDEARGKPFDKAQGKRVVHYSEYRTPLTPFDRPPEEEIIDLQTFTKRESPPAAPQQPTDAFQPITVNKPPEAKKPEPPAEKKPQEPLKPTPTIEGNIIDLKNL